jgi:hypothetical protein
MGQLVPRLLDDGLPLGTALRVATEGQGIEEQYTVVGDGGMQVTRAEEPSAFFTHVEPFGGGEYRYRAGTLATDQSELGSVVVPYSSGIRNCHPVGDIAEARTTEAEFEASLARGDRPVRFDEDLRWSSACWTEPRPARDPFDSTGQRRSRSKTGGRTGLPGGALGRNDRVEQRAEDGPRPVVVFVGREPVVARATDPPGPDAEPVERAEHRRPADVVEHVGDRVVPDEDAVAGVASAGEELVRVDGDRGEVGRFRRPDGHLRRERVRSDRRFAVADLDHVERRREVVERFPDPVDVRAGRDGVTGDEQPPLAVDDGGHVRDDGDEVPRRGGREDGARPRPLVQFTCHLSVPVGRRSE